MCKECGCGGELSHESHGHGMDVHVPVLDANDRLAERNRGFFAAKNLLVINVFSSPGSGKTSLLQKTAEMLRGRVRMGVIVGDLATDNDAERLSRADIPVVQITTGTMCHLDARMIAEAMKKMPLDDLDVLIIENVGNLVCPASYDLGEGVRVVLLSVTEGEDKPLKYPHIFLEADICVINKIDLAPYLDTDVETLRNNALKVNHHLQLFEVSATKGTGMDAWCDWLVKECAKCK